jgi:hypothetical protein
LSDADGGLGVGATFGVGRTLAGAGFALSAAGFALGAAGFTLSAAGFTLSAAGFTLGAAGFTLSGADFVVIDAGSTLEVAIGLLATTGSALAAGVGFGATGSSSSQPESMSSSAEPMPRKGTSRSPRHGRGRANGVESATSTPFATTRKPTGQRTGDCTDVPCRTFRHGSG